LETGETGRWQISFSAATVGPPWPIKRALYQFHFLLRAFSTGVSRRLHLCSDSSIAELRYTLQIAFPEVNFTDGLKVDDVWVE